LFSLKEKWAASGASGVADLARDLTAINCRAAPTKYLQREVCVATPSQSGMLRLECRWDGDLAGLFSACEEVKSVHAPEDRPCVIWSRVLL
jgi:hypothetical protein